MMTSWVNFEREGGYSEAQITNGFRAVDSFIMDSYENREKIRQWLMEEKKYRDGEIKKTSIVSIFKGKRPKAILFSIQNETDRVEMMFTERNTVQVNVFFRNKFVSPQLPYEVVEYEGFFKGEQIATRLVKLSPNFTDYRKELDELLGEGKYNKSHTDTPFGNSVEMRLMNSQKNEKISQKQREDTVKYLNEMDWNLLDDSSLLELHNFVEPRSKIAMIKSAKKEE